MTFILVFRSICRQRWLRRHKSILLAEILNFQGAKPTLGVGSFSQLLIKIHIPSLSDPSLVNSPCFCK